MIKKIIVSIFLVIILILGTFTFYLIKNRQASNSRPSYVPGEIIIQFRPDITNQQVSDFLHQKNLTIKNHPLQGDYMVVAVPTGLEKKYVQELSSEPIVLNVSLNSILHAL